MLCLGADRSLGIEATVKEWQSSSPNRCEAWPSRCLLAICRINESILGFLNEITLVVFLAAFMFQVAVSHS